MNARRATLGLSMILFTALSAIHLQRLSAADRIAAPLEGTPLKFLLGDFNRKAAEDAIGKSEPKLTEDEVVAAIRAWIIRKKEDVDDDTVAIYKKIAETRTLPKGAELVFTTGWVTDELNFKVWWINLEIATGENRGYGLRIRERMIDCGPSDKPAADQALQPDADS